MTSTPTATVTRDHVLEAGERIAGRVRRTPLLAPAAGDGAWLKCEHLQLCGVFKTRGALAFQLPCSSAGAG